MGLAALYIFIGRVLTFWCWIPSQFIRLLLDYIAKTVQKRTFRWPVLLEDASHTPQD